MLHMDGKNVSCEKLLCHVVCKIIMHVVDSIILL